MLLRLFTHKGCIVYIKVTRTMYSTLMVAKYILKATVSVTALYLSVRDIHFRSPNFRIVIVIYSLLPKYNYLFQDFMCIATWSHDLINTSTDPFNSFSFYALYLEWATSSRLF